MEFLRVKLYCQTKIYPEEVHAMARVTQTNVFENELTSTIDGFFHTLSWDSPVIDLSRCERYFVCAKVEFDIASRV